jgi:hypothetical protein
VCDEGGIRGSGEYFDDNDSQLGRINVLYHEALSGKYVPHAILLDLEQGVIGAVTLRSRSASYSARATS